MFKITHIKWDRRRIGIATKVLNDGDNDFVVTAKSVSGEYHYPGVFRINKERAFNVYGPETIINKGNLKGIWVPCIDLERMRVQ